MKVLLWAAISVTMTFCLSLKQNERRDYPIIDVHNHAHKNVITAKICPFSGRLGITDEDGDTLCENILTPVNNGEELMRESIQYFDQYDMYSIVMTQDFNQIERWMSHSHRILPGIQTGVSDFSKNKVAELAANGKVVVIGEIVTQYEGIAPNSEELDPIWELAVKHDLPAGIHLAGPGAPTKHYITGYGNPLLLESVLKKYPSLRIYIMHGGWPYLEETVSILRQYPNVYLDISWISWQMPRELYYEYLEKLIQYGFEKRIMFGTDQVAWPKAIEYAVQGIEDAPFLSYSQKKNIFNQNAMRFFRFPADRFE